MMTRQEHDDAIFALNGMLNINHPLFTGDVVARARFLKQKLDEAYQRQCDDELAPQILRRIERLEELEEQYKDV